MTVAPDLPGRSLIVADAAGTAALLAVTVAAGASSADGVQVANLVVAAVLFTGGCVGFAVGFLRAVGRSREEVIDLAGLFYLTGSGPTAARRWFLGLWFAQIAIALGSVPVVDPPFGVMAPVWGIGLLTWWAARHGTFPARQAAPRR